jgi:seryl-tRNA synthetase
MSDPTENASGFTFPEKPQMNARFMAYVEQIVELYEKQEEYLKILGEFNKRREEAEQELNNANQTNESTDTELSVCDNKEEPIIQLEPSVPDPADDIQSECSREILYSS